MTLADRITGLVGVHLQRIGEVGRVQAVKEIEAELRRIFKDRPVREVTCKVCEDWGQVIVRNERGYDAVRACGWCEKGSHERRRLAAIMGTPRVVDESEVAKRAGQSTLKRIGR